MIKWKLIAHEKQVKMKSSINSNFYRYLLFILLQKNPVKLYY